MLKVEHLSVSYAGHLVLRDISLEMYAGEVLALIGPNGAGKSTLVRAISGVAPSVGGRVCKDGLDLLSVPVIERARFISVVPQLATLPPAFSVWETVLLGRTPHLNFLGQISARDEQVARCALEKADALSLAERRVGELSGGEQQRVLLARALAQSTPVMLLDEPTAHLDLQHQIGLLEVVRKLAREENLTVLIALHDLNLAARYADRVALLVDGELKGLGTAREVLQAKTIAQAYHWPVQVIPHPFLDAPLILPDVR